MGMDSYIYKTTKENFEKFLKQEVDDGDFVPLVYWRKPYGLHQYITQKFHNIGLDDNCVHIPLSKENIETIISDMRTNPRFFECDKWDFDDIVKAIKRFTKILDEWLDDDVITYYAFY